MLKSTRGFTIVELLIVIVVIAILAAITTIAFNGVQTRARESAATSSLQQVSRAMEVWRVDNTGTTPTALSTLNINDSDKFKYQYARLNSNANYYVTITIDTVVSYYINDTTQKTPIKGACPGHTEAGSGAGGGSSGVAVTDTNEWVVTNGPGSKVDGSTVWPVFMTGFTAWGDGNIYSKSRPIAKLNNLDMSWDVSTNATNSGSQVFSMAVVRGDITPIPNHGSWMNNAVRAEFGYTGDGIWQTIRWQSTVSGNTLTWSVTKDGAPVDSGTKDISTWSAHGWRLLPLSSYGNRNNTKAGIRGSINLP